MIAAWTLLRRALVLTVGVGLATASLTAVAAFQPSSAQASMAIYFGNYGSIDGIYYQADPGERNKLKVRLASDGKVELTDSGTDADGAPIVIHPNQDRFLPGVPDCASTGGQAICPALTRTYGNVNITTFDADDSIDADTDVPSGWIGSFLLQGGAGSDTIIGSRVADRINGNCISVEIEEVQRCRESQPGTDSLDGLGGDDQISTQGPESKGASSTARGGAGNDTLRGDGFLYGDADSDVLTGGLGSSQLEGGAGTDLVSYQSLYEQPAATSAVSVDLSATGAQATGGAGTDKLVSIENLEGSQFGDTLRGNAGANVIDGQYGDDTLLGGGGDDTLPANYGADTENGGPGIDTMDYKRRPGCTTHTEAFEGSPITYTYSSIAVTVTVDDGQFNDGSPNQYYDKPADPNAPATKRDNVSEVESVKGTPCTDSITGGNSATSIFGDAGNDSLRSGVGGGVLFGGTGDDQLLGHNVADILLGEAGNDTMYGLNGSDYYDGGTGSDTLSEKWGPYTTNGNDTFRTREDAGSLQQKDKVESCGVPGGKETVISGQFDEIAAGC